MTGMGKEGRRVAVRPLAVCSVLAALALAGCNSMTYGTGTSPAMQTLEDITGVATLGGKKQDPIDYAARPKIVAPPAMAGNLPPPQTTTASDKPLPNWPNDPDALRSKVIADAEARNAAGLDPNYRLAKGQTTTGAIAVQNNDPNRKLTPEELAKAKQAFADAKGAVAVDANGNPVRRYLTDPPVDYRVPDPTAPVDVANAPKPKKKFKWWWQQ
jgi:hypothetical protein